MAGYECFGVRFGLGLGVVFVCRRCSSRRNRCCSNFGFSMSAAWIWQGAEALQLLSAGSLVQKMKLVWESCCISFLGELEGGFTAIGVHSVFLLGMHHI